MSIRGSKKKMVGVLLPPNINEYIILYAIEQELSKTKLCEDILSIWYKNKSRTIPETMLLNNIKEYIKRGWKGAKCRGESFETYMNITKQFLIKKGLTDLQIQSILDIQQ